MACGACVELHCGALELIGYERSVEQIMAEVMKDKLYYDCSGGGITLSGGEPLAQFAFCMELLQVAKASGLHICMETCGYADKTQIMETAQYVDLYLFDIKETDSVRHRQYTGVEPSVILENLFCLDSLGKQIVLRCPIIPGYNDREDHFSGIAEIANRLQGVVQIEVEPYHAFGASKYTRLGLNYPLLGKSQPEKNEVERWCAYIQNQTTADVRRA